ncbi:MAG: 50S ribosomal protein L14 [Candidatus Pacebacteria bacterium]|nr:50S ribosomal protein L14 [Candidatus Paceibacterota bacterium]
MIQLKTMLNVADNSGAKIVQCIQLPGGTRKRTAILGDIVVGVVKKAEPRREVKEHSVVKVVIVRQKQPYRRKDGSYIRFDENACCLVADDDNPKGNRISGPIPRELKEKGFDKIATLAEELV